MDGSETTTTTVAASAAVGSFKEESLKRPADLGHRRDFRVATYNVKNLFGEEHDPYSGRPSPPASEEQCKALGEVIRALDADVIALQEVQSEPVLRDLFQQYVNKRVSKEERYTTFAFVPARDPRGINVALVTRLAVRGTMTFHDYEFGPQDERAIRFSRDLLGVEVFVTPVYMFLCFIVHLKAKIGGERAEGKRRLEATEIRTLLGEPVFGGNPYIEQDLILAGDMNDDPESNVIGILGGAGPGPRLADILAEVEPNYTYPTHTKYKKTRLDFMFASPSMIEHVAIDTAAIHRDEPTATASDHYPSSVTIRVPS
jgi:endonuclease/exonuclease/phosphatase family metal-dependent hydrolase